MFFRFNVFKMMLLVCKLMVIGFSLSLGSLVWSMRLEDVRNSVWMPPGENESMIKIEFFPKDGGTMSINGFTFKAETVEYRKSDLTTGPNAYQDYFMFFSKGFCVGFLYIHDEDCLLDENRYAPDDCIRRVGPYAY